jgi:hypothetical protein
VAIHPEIPLARIELIPAEPEQEPIVSNLLQLYAHDFSEFHSVEIGDDGRFVYPQLPLYWGEPGRHPFLIRVDGKLAGLVLVKRGPEISHDENVWDMTEFLCSSWISQARSWHRGRPPGVETISGNVGSACHAVECLGTRLLGEGHRRVYGTSESSSPH